MEHTLALWIFYFRFLLCFHFRLHLFFGRFRLALGYPHFLPHPHPHLSTLQWDSLGFFLFWCGRFPVWVSSGSLPVGFLIGGCSGGMLGIPLSAGIGGKGGGWRAVEGGGAPLVLFLASVLLSCFHFRFHLFSDFCFTLSPPPPPTHPPTISLTGFFGRFFSFCCYE